MYIGNALKQALQKKTAIAAAVEKFRFDLQLNFEGQHMLMSLWFQRQVTKNK